MSWLVGWLVVGQGLQAFSTQRTNLMLVLQNKYWEMQTLFDN